jgi:hypothetical protein
MRVSFVDPGKRLVLTGALGPLLNEAVTGVMDIRIEKNETGTRVSLLQDEWFRSWQCQGNRSRR